jgi:hypothetical protein
MSNKDLNDKSKESADKDDSGSAGRKPPISSLSRLAPPRSGTATAAAGTGSSGSGSLTTSVSSSLPTSSPKPAAAVGSGSGVAVGVTPSGSDTAAEYIEQLLARLEAKLEAKFTAKLEDAKLAAHAVNSLPPPPKTPTAAKKPKTGILGALVASAGYNDGAYDNEKHEDVRAATADVDADDDTDPSGQDDNGDDGKLVGGRRQPVPVDLSRPIGSLLWTEEIAVYGSALSYVRMQTFKENRNRHECEVFARSLDAMRAEGITMSSRSFEIQIRRLIGVRIADEYKDWSFAEALAWQSSAGVQHRGLLRSLLKDRKNFADLKKPAATTTTAAQSFSARKGGRGNGRGGRGGRGGGRGGGWNNNNNNNNAPASRGGAGNH